MSKKKIVRLKRAKKSRAKISEVTANRLCIHRTPRHIYAQVIAHGNAKVLASASTLDTQIKSEIATSGNKDAAKIVGRVIAERAKLAGVNSVAFDRSGFKYHGRVKALADAAREQGLEF